MCLMLALLLSVSGCQHRITGNFDTDLKAYKKGDFATALRLSKPFAEQGYACAQFSLGLMYTKGQDVPQDYKEAVKWYRLAAKQGEADAQSDLGVVYENGEGVPQDYETALKWGTPLLPNISIPMPNTT